jgi:hypothetical protein
MDHLKKWLATAAIILESREEPDANLRKGNQDDKAMPIPQVYCVRVGESPPNGMISFEIPIDRRGD